MSETKGMTGATLDLFFAYANDAENWGGTPLFNGNVCLNGEREDSGNLIWLKRAGLVTTFVERGATWIRFTEAGRALARDHGIEV
jgi:hypothetical protein